MHVTSSSRLACCALLCTCLFNAIPGHATEKLDALLDKIRSGIADIRYSGKHGDHRYRFAWDTDFPCSVTILEDYALEGEHWVRRYRFELSDMKTGHLVSTKDRRRAITYYGEKNSQGIVKKFPPKKISAIQLHTSDNSQLQILFDSAIGLCEERNTFPE